MIRNMGYEYTVKVSAVVEVKVTAFDYDGAEEEAMKLVEEALKDVSKDIDTAPIELERGEEALDITEDDE